MERAFGVLKGKFRCLLHPCEKWEHKFVCKMAKACVILHNCCVEERILDGEIDDLNLFDYDELAKNERPTVTEKEVNAEDELVSELQSNLEEEITHDNVLYDEGLEKRISYIDTLPLCLRVAQKRWETLYNVEQNTRLRNAIIRHKHSN